MAKMYKENQATLEAELTGAGHDGDGITQKDKNKIWEKMTTRDLWRK